ncbi:hypothetical protein [Thiorhodococcus mannitoliphagus]|uniref:hypothetical protein n=1 Tax=Thiorhodococcus mannitoliphagus TaxID=329406 RepID=UPI001F0F4512|nr:hypothetical protein [Thiorhodococcus mannitoliphagus]
MLHRLSCIYKQPEPIPRKADAEVQKAFLAEYEKLKQTEVDEDLVHFMDAVHPQHNPVIAAGWIERDRETALQHRAQAPEYERCDQPRAA